MLLWRNLIEVWPQVSKSLLDSFRKLRAVSVEPEHDKTNKIACAFGEVLRQTGHKGHFVGFCRALAHLQVTMEIHIE